MILDGGLGAGQGRPGGFYRLAPARRSHGKSTLSWPAVAGLAA